MRTLMIAAIVGASALSATAADAQRIGSREAPATAGAQGWGQPMPPQGNPQPMPMPPQGNPQPMPMPPRPNPGGWQGQPRPNPQPMPPRANPGGWNGGGQWNGGSWSSGNQWNGRSRWGGRIGGFWWAGVQAPGGWNGYTRIKRGKRLPSYWVSPNFVIADWQLFGLGAPPAGYNWTRYYNDAVLIDRYGVVYDTIGNVDWDRYQGGSAYDEEYSSTYDGYAPAPQGPDYGAPYPAPGYGGGSSSVRTYTYTTGGGYPAPAPMPAPMPRIAYGNTYYTGPGAVTTIVIPGAVTTTTTTTEIVEERSYVAPKRVVRKVVRKWRPRPKPRCVCGS